MAGAPKEPGPAARRVAETIRRFRRGEGQGRGITTAELSRRLTTLGQPIPDTSITKTEQGTRRVDVDDLVALALALGITPNTLLMPEADWLGAGTVHHLTPAVAGTAEELWQWAQGERPLPVPFADMPSPAQGNRALEFTIRSRSYLLVPRAPGGISPDRELRDLAIAVTRAARAGATGTEIRRVAEMTLARPASALLTEDEIAMWLDDDQPRPERRNR
jgi:transcriptional regulator with XRE-family HTH domain